VYGSGNPGEDYDTDRAAGDGAVPSASRERDNSPSGGQPVEDRDNVGIVKPKDYLLDERAKGETD
jgi:hypothetical protein